MARTAASRKPAWQRLVAKVVRKESRARAKAKPRRAAPKPKPARPARKPAWQRLAEKPTRAKPKPKAKPRRAAPKPKARPAPRPAPRPRARPAPRPRAAPRRNYVNRPGPRGQPRWFEVVPDARYRRGAGFREDPVRGRPKFRRGDEVLYLTGKAAKRLVAAGPRGGLRLGQLTDDAAGYAAESLTRAAARRDDPRLQDYTPYAINRATGWTQKWDSYASMQKFFTEAKYAKARSELHENQEETELVLGIEGADGDLESVVIELGGWDEWESFGE